MTEPFVPPPASDEPDGPAALQEGRSSKHERFPSGPPESADPWEPAHTRQPQEKIEPNSFPGPPEIIEWVAMTVASGALGNVAYDGMKGIVVRLWQALRERRRPPRPITASEAMALAEAAIRARYPAIDIEPSGPESLQWHAFEGIDGYWQVAAGNFKGRSFLVRVPVGRRTRTVTVKISLPEKKRKKPRRRHRAR